MCLDSITKTFDPIVLREGKEADSTFFLMSRGDPNGLPICLPMQETWALFLGQKDSLEEEMATHSSILAWEIP